MTHFAYQESNQFFAQVAGGLESLTQDELRELGARKLRESYRGVYFSVAASDVSDIVYQTRLATRVLAPLRIFDCHSDRYLHRTAMDIAWPELFPVDATFAVFANVSNSFLKHSKYVALKVKDAIVDRFRQDVGRRPNVDQRAPHALINVYIHNNKATISLDLSGGSLHRRGYRERSVDAPMQETAAAAIVRLSGWSGEGALHDPFCGSGTLLAEALMAGAKIPAGYLRQRFGFEVMPEFDSTRWKSRRGEINQLIRPITGTVSGGDRDAMAVTAAQVNLRTLPQGKSVVVKKQTFDSVPLPDTTIITNPPFGIRLGDPKSAAKLTERFGNFLKHSCERSVAYVYFGERTLLKSLGLRPAFRMPLANGGLDGRLAKVELYAGTRRYGEGRSDSDVDPKKGAAE